VERIKIAYAEGKVGGHVQGITRSLAQFQFDVVIFGTSEANAQANMRTFQRAITDPMGGHVQYRPSGLGGSVISTYYHYLMSPPMQLFPVAGVQGRARAWTRPGGAITDEAYRYRATLMTKAWGTSDPTSYSSIVTSTGVDNEGGTMVVPASSIKGDGALGVLEVVGTMSSGDDVLKNAIVYKRKMRVGNNSDLDWIEAENMQDPVGGNYNYAVFCGIVWRAPEGDTNYPIDIVDDGFDTDSLTTAKMQADGDDLRVFNGGVEIDRWLYDMDNATTQVWCNLDFAVAISMTLNGGISSSIQSVVVNESIAGMPSTGIIKIDSEYLSYSSKNNSSKTFTISSRGYGNTTAASHSDSVATYWVQHDLWIVYGDAGASTPAVNDDYEPAFELSSTNGSWVYQEFGEDDGFRTAGWIVYNGWLGYYNGNRRAAADPWIEIGLGPAALGELYWYLHNPCQITNANFTNGESLRNVSAGFWTGEIRSSQNGSAWTTEYTIPDPAVAGVWDSWSRNEAITAGATYVSMYLQISTDVLNQDSLEAADCTLTLNPSYTPVVTVEAEIAYAWTQIGDAAASGNNYMRLGIPVSYLAITSSNTAGMDRTYTGKVSPLVIARCDVGTNYNVHWVVYVSNRVASWQTSRVVLLEGSTYWKCLYQFGEIDLPPFPIPDYVSEANIDSYIDTVFIELTFTRISGGGNIEVDAVCLAKADEWISHVYNSVDSTGLQESTDDTLVIDAVENITHTKDASDLVKQYWERQGVPLSQLAFDKRFDHRLRVVGFMDTSTYKYTPTYTFNVVLTGLFLTIFPFSET
jgi:hypothetical protein